MIELEACLDTVMGEQGVQEGAEHTPLGGPVLRISGLEVMFPTFTTWEQPARQEVQDPVAQGGVQTQGLEINDWRVQWC